MNNKRCYVVAVLLLVMFVVRSWNFESSKLPEKIIIAKRPLKYTTPVLVDTAQVSDLNKSLKRLFTFLRKIEGKGHKVINNTLDEIPYPRHVIQNAIKFPAPHELPFLKLPDVPPAPTGVAALRLARQLRYPDKWRARQRPELFILGPPKTGTTFLEACFKWSMFGNQSKRIYPLASERWPTKRLEGGEPTYEVSPTLEGFRMWNRTGFRRWDPPKEWWLYPEMGRYPSSFRGFINTQRFPPVEDDSKNWFIIDSTPDTIMIPKAAQALHLDLQGAPFKPSFLVMQRDALSRAYSHFLLFTSLRVDWGWGKEPFNVFSEKLDDQMKILESIPICRKMLYEPFEIIKNLDQTYLALRWCMYDPRTRNQVMYLPFGFTALGLRYWLSKFKSESFSFMKFSTLKVIGKNTNQLFDFYEEVFPGVKRNHPRCEHSEEWNSGNCTGWKLDDIAVEMCGPNSPALKSQAWSSRKGLNFTKGDPENLKKYQEISDEWDKVIDSLANKYNISWYEPNE